MRRSTRSALALLLALPMAASAMTANAAPPSRYSYSADRIEAGGLVLGQLDGFTGNVHFLNISGDRTNDISVGFGSLESYTCPEGVTSPWNSATRSRIAETHRDPATGTSWRGTTNQTMRSGSSAGTVNGVSVDNGWSAMSQVSYTSTST